MDFAFVLLYYMAPPSPTKKVYEFVGVKKFDYPVHGGVILPLGGGGGGCFQETRFIPRR